MNESPTLGTPPDPDRTAAGTSDPPAAACAPADVREHLARHPEIPPEDVVELLCTDQMERWRKGERVPAEAYLRLHPALQGDGAQALAVVYGEFVLREQLGEQPALEEFLWRFPHFADRLRRQVALHRALQAEDQESGPPTVAPDDLPPALGPDTVPAPAPPVPRSGLPSAPRPAVPGYEILEELGRGGMGVVYKARQTKLKRVVALKMILAGAHANAAQLTRFRAEAEAVARLQHPNIVQIHEVGEHQGLPYFSLEFVDGGSLDKQLAGHPQPAVPAARLVEKLARAMDSAHQKGIIHRDLKPANVLLAAPPAPAPEGKQKSRSRGERSGSSASFQGFTYGEPKITDFGLAKQLESDAGHTRSGAVLGTPSYMAPEQARGAQSVIGPATDVYALGAILYEMLTGRPPFRAATAMETVNQVLAGDPVPPRRLNPKVPRDLETICLKCLEKEPRKRYAGALDLADDLRRFQDGEPIQARPTSAWERGVKWARRRPAVAALLAVSALAVFSLLVGAFWYNARVRAERDRAEANFDLALKAVEEMLTEVGTQKLADEPGMEQTRRTLLEKALHFYQEFVRQKSTDPLLRRKLAQAYKNKGDILRQLGRYGEAEEAYGQAITLSRQLADDSPDEPEHRHLLAESSNWLGETFRLSGQLPQAREAYEKALKLQQGLIEQSPDRVDYRKEKARSYSNLGLAFRETSQAPKAREAFAEAIAILTRLTERSPGPDLRQELARAYLNQGPVSDGFKAARGSYDDAVAILRRLAEKNPRNREYRHELGISYNNRGNLFRAEGERLNQLQVRSQARKMFARSEADHEQALRLFTALADNFSSYPTYRKELANTYNSLGAVHYFTSGPGASEKAWREALKLLETLPEQPEYQAARGYTLGNLGWLLTKQNDWARACPYYESAVRQFSTALKANRKNPYYRQALSRQYRNLAETLLQLKRHSAAAAAARELAGVDPDNGEGDFFAACFLARCADLVKGDQGIRDAARLRKQYADEAMHMLRRAVRNRYQVDFQDPNLRALRDRTDFQKLSGRS
jgi:serine/threonine protein kinase/Flp pilus assembly protein TadD